jgi:hypothetical protein
MFLPKSFPLAPQNSHIEVGVRDLTSQGATKSYRAWPAAQSHIGFSLSDRILHQVCKEGNSKQVSGTGGASNTQLGSSGGGRSCARLTIYRTPRVSAFWGCGVLAESLWRSLFGQASQTHDIRCENTSKAQRRGRRTESRRVTAA